MIRSAPNPALIFLAAEEGHERVHAALVNSKFGESDLAAMESVLLQLEMQRYWPIVYPSNL